MTRRGVTIIEIIVVIAIIAMLLGLTSLTLSGVRSAGRNVSCLNNLRQMSIGARQYALQYNYFPPAIRYERRNGGLIRLTWDWVTTFDGQIIDSGALWQFTDNPGEIHQCPEYEGPSNFNGDPFTGYNYNTSYLGGEAPFPQVGWNLFRPGIPSSTCTRSSTCVVFGDGGWLNGANKFMRAPENPESMPWSLVYSGGQAFRHRGSTNTAYIDGHVGHVSRPRKGIHATDSLLSAFMDYPDNGFLSNDDRAYKPR